MAPQIPKQGQNKMNYQRVVKKMWGGGRGKINKVAALEASVGLRFRQKQEL
jgi:hypothetical protein